MSKSSNAQKRFRQGRLSYKKLQSLLSKYKQDSLDELDAELGGITPSELDVQLYGDVPPSEEHIHSEHCNHNLPELMPDPDDQEVEV